MDFKITLNITKTNYPALHSMKKKDLDQTVTKIFKTGYDIYYPSNEKIEQQIAQNELLEHINIMKDELKNEISNSDTITKINSLETLISKLIGLSSNSQKKGNFAENVLEDIFSKRYGDIQFERKSGTAHSGDAWLTLPNDKKIVLESKNYATTINKDEVKKLESDMINHHIKWGLMVSFNSQIQGMKEMDIHSFTHNNETYYVVMISNLSEEVKKLDLGIQIIRTLMSNIDDMEQFPWIVKDINHSLFDLEQTVQTTYKMRDHFAKTEIDIYKSLSAHSMILRDYQVEIDKKVKEIISKIKNTMTSSIEESKDSINNYDTILEEYKDSKNIYNINRTIDIFQNKKWIVQYNEDDKKWYIYNSVCDNIGTLKIQAKKLLINIMNDNMTVNIVLQLGEEKENKKHFDILNSL